MDEDTDDTDDTQEPLDSTKLRALGPSPLNTRFSPRQRAVRGLTIVGSVLLVLAVLLSTSPTVRQGALLLLLGPTPTSTAALAPGDDLFYVLPGPPWARVTLDGHPLSHLPVIGTDRPLRLARGHHQLHWQAAPFSAWPCTISVPVSGSDTCPYDKGYVGKPGVTPFWVVFFAPATKLLPNDQWSALLAAVQAALDAERSTEVVRVGEPYVATPQSFPNQGHRADQPLRATLSFHLQAQTSVSQPPNLYCATTAGQVPSCTFLDQDCLPLCSVPEAGALSYPTYWSVLAPVYGTWDVATMAGQQVASGQPDSSAVALAPLRITRTGAAWHVVLAPSVPELAYTSATASSTGEQPIISLPACAGMAILTQSGGAPLYGPAVPEYADVSWRFATGTPLAAGCLGVATPLPSGSGTPSAAPLPPAYVLQRFGIVRAANATAQQALPELPVADAYEQALASQIAAGTP